MEEFLNWWRAQNGARQGPIQPELMAREPAVVEGVEDWLADKLRRVSGDTNAELGRYESQALAKRLAGIMDILPGPGTAMSGVQAFESAKQGDYPTALANGVMTFLDILPASAAANRTRGLLD